MSQSRYMLLDSPIGRLAVAWLDDLITGVDLPPRPGESAGRRFARSGAILASPPFPAAIDAAIHAVTRLLSGERVDLAFVRINLARMPRFDARVYAAIRNIPPGSLRTYGEVARAVGAPGAAQAVGQALGRNPWPIIIPCHRVTAADGRMGGFSAPGGAGTKRRLLEIEGAIAPETLPLFASAASRSN